MESSFLQILGWILTLAGQIQVARKRKSAFVVWAVANVCMVAVQWRAELYVSAGMFVTNLAICIWSYVVWKRDEPNWHYRPLFVGKLD